MGLRTDPSSLGIGTSAHGAYIYGIRTSREANNGAGTAIAATSDGQVLNKITIPMGPLDVLWILAIGAKVSEVDALGFLSLIGMDFSVYSDLSTASVSPGTFGNLPLNYQPPPILSMPKIAGNPVSLAIVPPPALYRKDLDVLNESAVPNPNAITISSNVYFRNSDAAPHSAFSALDVIFRIISGGDFT